MLNEPKLRKANKVKPPFGLNQFPKTFIYNLAKELVYIMATKTTYSLEGNEFEEIFASSVGADWKPSNVGLDDIVLGNCCWGAKTVKSSLKNISKQTAVKLISGRNSPAYSYGIDEILKQDPNYIGKMVLDIWNERVSSVREIFKFVRTIVLVKGSNFGDFMVFEFDAIRYDLELYEFKWNKNKNLEGFLRTSNVHCFTWQPHGSQFTIIERIPSDRTIFRVTPPEKLDKKNVLEVLNYSDEWVTFL